MTSNSEKNQWRRPKRSQYTGTGLQFTGTAVSNYYLIFSLCFEFVAYRGQYYPLTRGSAPGPHWGLCPQTPAIGSRSRARHKRPLFDPPLFVTFRGPCMLPVAVARSSSDGNAISYVLSVLWMTSCLQIIVTTRMFRRDGGAGRKVCRLRLRLVGFVKHILLTECPSS